MNGKVFSEALGSLPEDMVAEAMEPAHARSGFSWLRLAACIAIVVGLFFGFWPAQPEIVTAPGILAVTVYAVDEVERYKQIQLKEGIDTGWTNVWPLGLSVAPGIPVTLSVESEDYADEDITFLVTTEKGGYCVVNEGKMEILRSQFTLKNDSNCYWDWHFGFDENDPSVYYSEMYNSIYTDIVIYCGEHIIGYALLRFDRTPDNARAYSTSLIASVMFPKIDGRFQRILPEYVEMCISHLKE